MSNVVPFENPRDYARVHRRMKRLWDEGVFEIHQHAQEAMAKRTIDLLDIQNIILRGSIVSHDLRDGQWRYRDPGGHRGQRHGLMCRDAGRTRPRGERSRPLGASERGMIMTCEMCSAPMTERSTNRAAPYRYTLAGLPHVGLVGIVVFECPNGHPSVPRIPRVGELHRVIAETFIEKSDALIGSELRFLRKNAGFSAQKFAALLRVDPAHLSRVENGKTAMGASMDHMARAIVLAAKDGEVRELLLNDAAERLAKKKGKPHQLPLFRLERNRWKEAA